MKSVEYKKKLRREKKTLRVRKKLRGTAQKPRLCVVKSNMHIEAQIIDDETGVTLVSLNTRQKEFHSESKSRCNRENAKKIGAILAERATQKQISEIVFDRGAHKYHGVLADLADQARANGLKF